jgi:D-alanyl-D-alanine carboxypeptidase
MADGSCYILPDGTLATLWQEIDGVTHYFNDDGTPYAGFMDTTEGRRFFSENGAMLTGWQTVNGNTYYFKEDGFAVVGKQTIDEKTYYFTSTGANIILVNPWNYLPEDYEVELVELESGHKMAPECYEALMRMLADCEAAGHKPYLYSSYRTYAHQQRLFDNMLKQEGSYSKASKIVAVPGTSEHQLGYAVDITDNGYRKLNKEQANTATQQWLMANCWDYGFIVRYPIGTTAVTGIIYEPWHYRYVGPELAAELKESGITLEEYLDRLTNDGTTCGNPDALPKQ